MMFASKTPRDLNGDPHPFVWDRHSPFNQMRTDTDMFRRGAPARLPDYSYRPRPEYDHPQTNEPNPILRSARLDAVSVYGSQIAAAQAYLDHIDERSTIRTAAAGLGVWTLDHIDHARRVLTRVAALETRA